MHCTRRLPPPLPVRCRRACLAGVAGVVYPVLCTTGKVSVFVNRVFESKTIIYFILLILGLLIGAIFLTVLLIGDRKEARLEAQRKAMQVQMTEASQPVKGTWPPPPSVSALPDLSQSAPIPNPTVTREKNRKMVRTFFLVRNYAAGTVILAYIVYSCFPQLNFGWVLLGTALAAGAVWAVLTKLGQTRQSSNRL